MFHIINYSPTTRFFIDASGLQIGSNIMFNIDLGWIILKLPLFSQIVEYHQVYGFPPNIFLLLES